MLQRLKYMLEMIRFSHTLFALPFAMMAAMMAWLTPSLSGEPVPFRWLHLLGILICMVSARSAAMAFNRLADRKFDAENPRTAKRHLPAGLLSVQSVVVFLVASSLLFVNGTLLFLPNWLPLALSLPVLLILLAYSLTKRFTSLAHFWLGFSLALAPIATWIALRGQVVLVDVFDLLPAVLLGAAVMFWVSGFDMIYACQDYAYDKTSALKSIPKWLGIRGALRLAAVCHAVMLLILLALPEVGSWGGPPLALGWIYFVGVGLLAGLLIYEHLLVKPNDLSRVNVAFFHVNTVVSLGLFLVVTVDLLV
jgi:4-hydroxybenzoate polyprenyltransferase